MLCFLCRFSWECVREWKLSTSPPFFFFFSDLSSKHFVLFTIIMFFSFFFLLVVAIFTAISLEYAISLFCDRYTHPRHVFFSARGGVERLKGRLKACPCSCRRQAHETCLAGMGISVFIFCRNYSIFYFILQPIKHFFSNLLFVSFLFV